MATEILLESESVAAQPSDCHLRAVRHRSGSDGSRTFRPAGDGDLRGAGLRNGGERHEGDRVKLANWVLRGLSPWPCCRHHADFGAARQGVEGIAEVYAEIDQDKAREVMA